MIKTNKIIIKIIIVKKLYKLLCSKEKRPNAIPSFQTRIIFRNPDVKISEIELLLLK
jgi:hypothetical protein